jgi:hypothetical protein
MLATQDPFRKIQDRIDRLARRRTEVGLTKFVQNVLKLATADFDAPLTDVAA